MARVLGADPRAIELLEELNLSPADLIERERRVPCRALLDGFQRLVEAVGDPLLGLRAGAQADEGMFDLLEHAARATENLGEALEIFARYGAIINECAQFSVKPVGEHVHFAYETKMPHPACANDFVIASGLAFARRNSEYYVGPHEVWLAHEEPSYAAAYAQYFDGAPVRFGAPHNCIVILPAAIGMPMKMRNHELASAFELKLQESVRGLAPIGSATRSVREALAAQLLGGSLEMSETARRVGMSVATLRRKLEEEDTSWSALFDDLRHEAARKYLSAAEPSVTEIALRLGFSDVRAFGRAFKRWAGSSPSEFRDEKLGAGPAHPPSKRQK